MKPTALALRTTASKEEKRSLALHWIKIDGIGPKTVELLISHFGSVKKVMEAKKEELEKIDWEGKIQKDL